MTNHNNNINTGNEFLQYIDALEKGDHGEVKRLEQDALDRVQKKERKGAKHVSLKQMRAIRR